MSNLSSDGTVSVRALTVAPGNHSDVCPRCGIHRQNAGFLRETCGDGYLKPGCFVISTDERRSS